MTTVWMLIERCFEAAQRTEELLRTPGARKQFAYAPETALRQIDIAWVRG